MWYFPYFEKSFLHYEKYYNIKLEKNKPTLYVNYYYNLKNIKV